MRGWLKATVLAAGLGAVVWATETLVSFRATLRHRDVRSVAARIGEELGPRGTLRVDPATNSISLSDDRGRVDAARTLLQALDVPARRFALQAEFGVYEAPRGPGILREPDAFADATAWLEKTRPTREGRAVMDVREGGTAEVTLLPGYTLRAVTGGYDPTRRKLGFAELRVTRGSGPQASALLRGRAALPEGEATIFVIAPRGEEERCRLSLTPSLLPAVDEKEVP